MKVNRISKPRGKIQTPLSSTLPSLVEEANERTSSAQHKFVVECSGKILESSIFSRENGRKVLIRQHHGRKTVPLSGESILLLMQDIVFGLENYAKEELKWINYDEGNNYRCLREAADRIHPAGQSFYSQPRVKPLRETQDLRKLAKQLQKLAKKNKINWTSQKRWQEFLKARRNLVGQLWVSFDINTRQLHAQNQELPDTAIYQWIAKILSEFRILTKEQATTKLWNTIRHDRESENCKIEHLPGEHARQKQLLQMLAPRRQLIDKVLSKHHNEQMNTSQ